MFSTITRLTVKICYVNSRNVLLLNGMRRFKVVHVEQVHQALPLPRSNGWRYMEARGVTYRHQAVFGTGLQGSYCGLFPRAGTRMI